MAPSARMVPDGRPPVASGSRHIIYDQTVRAFPGERTVITIGAYDGVHLGHQAVISHVRQRALELGARSAVVTFDRHPASVVRPESAPLLLTGPEQKMELLEATGVDAVAVVPFNEEQAGESPESFVQRVLVECLGTKVIVVGEDFHFGRHRDGNVNLLRKLGAEHDFEVEPLELLPRADGVDEPVSSTAIRRALAGGDVTRANEMLGHTFEARGPVVTGDQRGRLLGFPTANVEVSNSMSLPADGVYAGWYERPSGELHPCAINLGRRPTFYEHADSSLLEAHLLDFEADLYGERARVRFTHFLRSERKFDGIEALKEQLDLDIAHARGLLSQ
jgi:riboflavin kinase/FMN adenylyltransferase